MGRVNRHEARLRRKKRVRRKIRGSSERPRLCVFRSSRHIYAQLIDDQSGKTVAEVSSISKELAPKIVNRGGNKEAAGLVGRTIAGRALASGINKVTFDRNGFLYHGRVKALSEGAREGGLEF